GALRVPGGAGRGLELLREVEHCHRGAAVHRGLRSRADEGDAFRLRGSGVVEELRHGAVVERGPGPLRADEQAVPGRGRELEDLWPRGVRAAERVAQVAAEG